MYRLRALSDIRRLFLFVAVLGLAGMLGGCAGTSADRVYGYYSVAPGSSSSIDVDGAPSHLTRAQEETIIAQAIVAHEMRRP